MKKLIAIALLLVSSLAQAEAAAEEMTDAEARAIMKVLYLKADNPDELAINAGTESDCSITGDELEEIVSGVLVRARVKPLTGDALFKSKLYMEARLHCVENHGNPIFVIQVLFGSYDAPLPVVYPFSYMYIGKGGEEFIVSNIKDRVEAAITDYIKVNLDQ
jgi:hypothetical protein